jgi:hypothetical protein
MWVPVRSFLRIVDDISMLYNHQQSPAWGMYVMLVGLFTLAALGVAALGVRHENRHSH